MLHKHLPGVEVWAYGSRVNGRSHDRSDLDLVLRGPKLAEIDTSRLADFIEALQDSTIPFLVEACDWARLPESFHREIEREHVVLVVGYQDGGPKRKPSSSMRISPLISKSLDMASGWPIMSLREAGVSLIDCEHRTPPASEYGYPYVAIPQVKDGRINLDGVRRITREHFDEWTRKAAPESLDIVLSRRCNPGETGFVSEGLKFALGQNLVLLRSNGTKVFKPFLRWLMRGPQWWEQVGAYINVGAVFDSLKCADIPGFRLLIPFLPEQRAIAHILGTLDDKIELNRRMNATLEAMARALFRSWFVDFDPVRAKMAGRDIGLPSHLADLFPDRLVDSELGEMPEGWETGLLGDVAEQPRRSVPPWKIAPGTPYIALEHMPKNRIALSAWGNGNGLASNKFAFKQGEILFGKLRPYFHKVGVAPVNGVCSTDIVVVAPRSPQWFGLVVGHVSSADFIHYTDAGSTGTKMPRTSWTDMALYELVLPPEPVAAAFTEMVQPAIDRIITQIHESRGLVALRDTLLPKLVSGELRAKQIEPESSISNISPDATGVQA